MVLHHVALTVEVDEAARPVVLVGVAVAVVIGLVAAEAQHSEQEVQHSSQWLRGGKEIEEEKIRPSIVCPLRREDFCSWQTVCDTSKQLAIVYSLHCSRLFASRQGPDVCTVLVTLKKCKGRKKRENPRDH